MVHKKQCKKEQGIGDKRRYWKDSSEEESSEEISMEDSNEDSKEESKEDGKEHGKKDGKEKGKDKMMENIKEDLLEMQEDAIAMLDEAEKMVPMFITMLEGMDLLDMVCITNKSHIFNSKFW